MEVLKIPGQLSEAKIESLLTELHKAGVEVDLHLPVALEYRGFGILPHFFLLVFTWIRHKKGKIILSLDPSDEAQSKEFIYSYYGYTLVSTVWKHCPMVNEKDENLRKTFQDFTSKMHDRIDFLENIPKEAVLIPNFDHYSKARGLSHWFYNSAFNYADSPSGLENTLFRILESLSLNLKSRVIKGSRNVFDELEEILWELAKNTDEHAVTDYLNRTNLTPNARCVFFRVHQSSKSNFIKNVKTHEGLSGYYEQALDENINYLLEISVFDSGPGIVKRFQGKDWTNDQQIAEDVRVIKRCLIKGQSSVNSTKGLNKGFGLDNVLKLLDLQKGFLKIRTGRASLYRDLIRDPYVETQDVDQVKVFDWKKCLNNSFTEMAPFEGTMISMVYPLNTAI